MRVVLSLPPGATITVQLPPAVEASPVEVPADPQDVQTRPDVEVQPASTRPWPGCKRRRPGECRCSASFYPHVHSGPYVTTR